jgi:hypothetical protein
MVARPVYAPALVAFVGGSGFSVAVGVGGGAVAAWIPLGPHEVYRPYYPVSAVYVRNVNVTHVTNVNVVNVTNVTYVNRTHVVAVPQGTFVGARPVAVAAVRVPPEAIGRAQVVNVAEVRPVRESYMDRPAEPGRRFGTPPAQVVSRTVVVKQAPPAAVRPMGGVRVAAPAGGQEGARFGRPANNPAPTPQVQSSRPVRNDRPASAYGNQAPANNAPAPRVNTSRPQPENAQAPRNAEAPRSEPRSQAQQASPPQHQPHEQKQEHQRQQQHERNSQKEDRKQ